MKEHPYRPAHRYSIDEFVGHFDHFVRSPEGTNTGVLLRYFSAHYPNQAEGRYKMDRFGMAFDYLLRHWQDFEQFVVVGEQRRGLVTKSLVVALARYYGPIPDERLSDEPAPEMILELAREEIQP